MFGLCRQLVLASNTWCFYEQLSSADLTDNSTCAWQALKYSEVLSQLESARQETSKVCRELEASQAETQAAKLASDAVTAQKAHVEETLAQHKEEHGKLHEVLRYMHTWASSWHDC